MKTQGRPMSNNVVVRTGGYVNNKGRKQGVTAMPKQRQVPASVYGQPGYSEVQHIPPSNMPPGGVVPSLN